MTRQKQPVLRSRVLLMMACFSFMVAPLACASSVQKTTSLRVFPTASAPPAARVTIDDQIVGSLALITEHGVALPPGKHRVTIEAEGYLPWDQEVDAGSGGGLVKLEVSLVKVPE